MKVPNFRHALPAITPSCTSCNFLVILQFRGVPLHPSWEDESYTRRFPPSLHMKSRNERQPDARQFPPSLLRKARNERQPNTRQLPPSLLRKTRNERQPGTRLTPPPFPLYFRGPMIWEDEPCARIFPPFSRKNAHLQASQARARFPLSPSPPEYIRRGNLHPFSSDSTLK